MRNIHDRLMKRVFYRKSEAKALIISFLPKWIYENLDFHDFKRSETSYVGEALQEYFMDIIYTCRTKQGKTIEIAFLFEHKSYYDEKINDQLLHYLTEAYASQEADGKRTLIMPIVIFHGNDEWKTTKFSDNFDLPSEEWRAFMPDFEYYLIDLNKVADEFLKNLEVGYFMRSTFLLFKHHRDTEYLLENTEEIFIFVKRKLSPEERRSFVTALIKYIKYAFKFNTKQEKAIIQKLKDMEAGIDFLEGSIAEREYLQAVAKAKEEFKDKFRREVKEEVRDEVVKEVRNEVEKEVRNEVEKEVRNEVEKEVRNEVEKEVRNEVEKEVRNEVEKEVRNEVKKEVLRSKLINFLQLYRLFPNTEELATRLKIKKTEYDLTLKALKMTSAKKAFLFLQVNIFKDLNKQQKEELKEAVEVNF